MTTITLEVPDDLAHRLDVERDRLPEVLEWALKLLPPRQEELLAPAPNLVFKELVEFLAARPTPKQIIAFKISPRAQGRLAELLEKNREEELTEAESAELDYYEYTHEIMTWLKAQVRATSPG